MKLAISKIKRNRTLLFIIVLMIISVLLKCYRFGAIPFGTHLDETGSAYDAWCIANFGADRYGIRYPVYFINFGGGQSALLTYMIALNIKIAGFSIMAIRLPMLFSSVLLLLFGTLIIHSIWDDISSVKCEYAEICYIVLYMTSPYVFMSARWSLDCNLFLGFSTVFLYFVILAYKKNKTWAYFAAGIIGGITLYTYALSYVIIPVFLILILLMAIKNHRIILRNFLVMLIPLLLISFPLILEQYINIVGKESILLLGHFTVTKLPNYRGSEFTLTNIPQNFVLLLKAILFHDDYDYNALPEFLTFYKISIALFAIGLVVFITKIISDIRKKTNREYFVIFIWFVCNVIVYCMLGKNGDSGHNPNTNKVNGIFYAVMFIIVIGTAAVTHVFKKKIWVKASSIAIASYFLICFGMFANYYFNEYQPSSLWGSFYDGAVKRINNDEALLAKTTFTSTNYIYYLVASKNIAVWPITYSEEQEFGIGNYLTGVINMPQYIEEYGYGANYIIPKNDTAYLDLLNKYDNGNADWTIEQYGDNYLYYYE